MSTASAAGQPLGQAITRVGAGSGAGSIEILSCCRTAEPIWRRLERDAVMSPYGRFDWVASFAASLPDAERDIRIAVMTDDAGPALLMPFRIERRFGLVIAAAIGGKHANLNLPVSRPDVFATLDAAAATSFLTAAGRAMQADMIDLPSVPAIWRGRPNPFAAAGEPAADPVWSVRLMDTGEKTLGRSMKGDARKKLRSKSRAMDAFGPVRVLRARTADEVDRLLDAFYRQKEDRFAELGIADPFAAPHIRTFLRTGALAGLAEGRPAIELHALTVGEEVAAVLGAAGDGRRLSGMFLSFQSGPLARFSPGEQLVTRVIGLQCEQGRVVFDLGVGDARYKRSICDEVEALVDVMLPITRAGRAVRFVESHLLAAKRRIKTNPQAMAMVALLRRSRAKLRHTGPAS
ncbi:GNAT family N-acetyltransferase [Enterovirga rhinocerotis]|uniref:CelD/BcsL family acetyltransferase involved in cellulose biosynthesis n=1 Tax=Enterovirga rhinocerotis TaxID=1339210 RepID=A0A4R7C8N5_9HYPH|nr:GNAT family N-acetyltransferase [Enterovirga rhinocerotis]TDR94342.1 CelD/BcsL family acetyltransferase involved in cellulose biosynthesis [Enterovirga rhinocerotis]